MVIVSSVSIGHLEFFISAFRLFKLPLCENFKALSINDQKEKNVVYTSARSRRLIPARGKDHLLKKKKNVELCRVFYSHFKYHLIREDTL